MTDGGRPTSQANNANIFEIDTNAEQPRGTPEPSVKNIRTTFFTILEVAVGKRRLSDGLANELVTGSCRNVPRSSGRIWGFHP